MFKEVLGFDIDLLKRGIAIKLTDTEGAEQAPRGVFFFVNDSDGMEYKFRNLSGIYLIKESSSTVLRLTDVSGEEIKIHIRHFLKDNPRMSIKILG